MLLSIVPSGLSNVSLYDKIISYTKAPTSHHNVAEGNEILCGFPSALLGSTTQGSLSSCQLKTCLTYILDAEEKLEK